MHNEVLVVTGSASLALALVEAWLLVASISAPNGAVRRLIPGTPDLLRSHIDYLMMSMFLFILFGLFSHFKIAAGPAVLLSMCLGSISNPLLFLVRAIKPSLKERQPPAFKAALGVSCILTTFGYLGAAYLVACSAIAEMQ